MQGTVVTMLLILAGLGTQNKENEAIEPLLGYSDSATQAQDQTVALPARTESEVQGALLLAYASPYPPSPQDAGHGHSDSIGHIFHETLYSFCHGHDDDVMTAKQIETAFYSGAYSAGEYYPSAVLSPDAPHD